MGFSCCHGIWKKERNSFLADGEDKNQYVNKWIPDSRLLKEIKWAPQCAHRANRCSLHAMSPFSSCWWPMVNTQNFPLCPYRVSLNRRQPEASVFCSAFLEGSHKCGWLTKIIKFSINTDVIRPSNSTFKRVMHSKKNSTLCGIKAT